MAELALFICSVIWSFGYLFSQRAVVVMEPNVIIAYRHLIAALVFLPFIRTRAVFNRTVLLYGSFAGVLLWLLLNPMTLGLREGSVSHAGFITSLFVVITPLISRVFLKTILRLRDWLSIIVSLVGLWCVTGGIETFESSDTMFLLAAFLCAMHIVVVEKAAQSPYDPYAFTFMQACIAGLCGTIASIYQGVSFPVPTSSVLWDLIYLGALSSGIGLLAQLYGQRTVPAWRACLIFASEPVMTACIAWMIVGEAYTSKTAIGGLLITAAIILPYLGSRRGNSIPS